MERRSGYPCSNSSNSNNNNNNNNRSNHYNPYRKNSSTGESGNNRQSKESPACELVNLPTIVAVQKETDQAKLKARQKEIDYGKNTIGYDKYLEAVPKRNREKHHPKTPDIHQRCSRRSWVGQIKKWRKELHKYDPEDNQQDIDFNDSADEVATVETDHNDNNNNAGTEDLEQNQQLLSSLLSVAATTTTTTTSPSTSQ
ncbi:hypothetical protein SAMD00019534_118810 [Acytostelium subglobosum LB1]|uniref:hypothetical protein n=1 Tax=Acytostelium subglobosum LB1 TaxID=1410327 RepID=UPI0006449CC3|nr:hypothetical protein SAMD00019534_118810 [Acytostelium subglobosum LB1]GAM28705.1 hypothetical protein SAMD00019534_118810 [Acytostelium subglobosum LB1]|eukprot:XP_012748260.1 hypothetical protein SAMD00019534_118810 [Acytostelium subglobosum LB1]